MGFCGSFFAGAPAANRNVSPSFFHTQWYLELGVDAELDRLAEALDWGAEKSGILDVKVPIDCELWDLSAWHRIAFHKPSCCIAWIYIVKYTLPPPTPFLNSNNTV